MPALPEIILDQEMQPVGFIAEDRVNRGCPGLALPEVIPDQGAQPVGLIVEDRVKQRADQGLLPADGPCWLSPCGC